MLRFYHADTKVLVYRADVFTSGSPVTFEYKARTTADLPGSIRVTSPVHLSYTSLPASLSRGGGRVYNTTQDLVRNVQSPGRAIRAVLSFMEAEASGRRPGKIFPPPSLPCHGFHPPPPKSE